MSGNKAVAYIGPGKVEIWEIDYPKFWSCATDLG